MAQVVTVQKKPDQLSGLAGTALGSWLGGAVGGAAGGKLAQDNPNQTQGVQAAETAQPVAPTVQPPDQFGPLPAQNPSAYGPEAMQRRQAQYPRPY